MKRKLFQFLWVSAVVVLAGAVIGGVQWQRASLDNQLTAAVSRHDAQQVGRLLARGADPNARFYPATHDIAWYSIPSRLTYERPPWGLSALMLASISGDDGTARLLLAHGAEVNATTKETGIGPKTALGIAEACLPYALKDVADPKVRRYAPGDPAGFSRVISLLQQAGAKA